MKINKHPRKVKKLSWKLFPIMKIKRSLRWTPNLKYIFVGKIKKKFVDPL